MYVNIDEARSNDQAASVQRLVRLAAKLARRRNLGDTTIHKQDVMFAVELLRRINEMAIANCQAIL